MNLGVKIVNITFLEYEIDTTNGDIEEMILLNLVVDKKVNSNELEDTFFLLIINNYLNQTNQHLIK